MTSPSAASRVHYLLGLLAAVVLLVAVGAVVSLGVQGHLGDAAWVTRTHGNLEQLAQLYSRTKDAESAQRGYLITGNNDFLGQFYAAKPDLVLRTQELAAMVADNPEQSRRVEELSQLIAQRMQTAEAVLFDYEEGGFATAQAKVRTYAGKQLMERIAKLVEEFDAAERRLLEERSRVADASAAWLQFAALGGIAASILLIALVFGFILRENRVRRLAEHRSEESSIELANTVMQLRRVGNDTEELRRYAGMLQSCRSIDEAMDITSTAFANLLPDLGGCVFLHRASQNLTEAHTRWGELAAETALVFHPDDCWALRRGQAYAVPDLRRASKCPHVERSDVEASTLCLPLAAQGETLGFLYLSGTGAGAVEAEGVATSAAEQLSLALCNLRLQETLRIQSIRDPLTGLYNRRYLEESLERELARCGRRNLPLAVMMLDVDHFKRFNDTHGHEGGDALLAQFAALLQAHCRVEDIACRFGGEEFTLIVPETAPGTAVARAEQIRAATEQLRVAHQKSQLSSVTVSIGIACFPQDGKRGEDLLRAADMALYRAKHEGRNRVVAAA